MMNQIKIGRGRDCDIQISDFYTKVSIVHAVIEIINNQYYITDYSTNGIYISGKEIQHNISTQIYSGDIIYLAREVEVSWYDINNLLPLTRVVTQGITGKEGKSPIKYASWGLRFSSYAIDFSVLIVIFNILFVNFIDINNMYDYSGKINENTTKGLIIVYGSIVIISWIYHITFESSKLMGTIGKRIVGLKIIDNKKNSNISFLQANIRFFTRMFLVIIPVVGLLNFLAPLWTKKKQTWHDSISSCIVLKK